MKWELEHTDGRSGERRRWWSCLATRFWNHSQKWCSRIIPCAVDVIFCPVLLSYIDVDIAVGRNRLRRTSCFERSTRFQNQHGRRWWRVLLPRLVVAICIRCCSMVGIWSSSMAETMKGGWAACKCWPVEFEFGKDEIVQGYSLVSCSCSISV